MDVPVTECEPLDECRWPDGDLRYLLLDGTNNCKSEGLVYVFFFGICISPGTWHQTGLEHVATLIHV